MDLLGEEAVGFPFPGKVRLGSVQMGLVDLLGKEAVGFPLFLDRGLTVGLVDLLGKEAVGFPFPGKVRLGSVQMGLVDLFGLDKGIYITISTFTSICTSVVGVGVGVVGVVVGVPTLKFF